MGVLSNKIDRKDLKPGDHIYSWRAAYTYAHHGIYVGEGMVIHFTRGGQEIGTGTALDRLILSSSPAHSEIGTGTVLDRLLLSSSPAHSAENPCPNCGDQSNLHGVISSCLDCFLGGGHLYRFEYGVSLAFFIAKARGGTCTLAPSDPSEDVLHRARYLLQNGFGAYNVFKNNCEDFAIYCKTCLLVMTNISAGSSGQAASSKAAVNVVVSSPLHFLTTSFCRLAPMTTGFCSLALVGCGKYCISRYLSDIGVRSDLAKVPVERFKDPSALDEPPNANEEERPVDPPDLNEPANTNEEERPVDPPDLNEPANTNEEEKPVDPPGLNEPAKANEVIKED